VTNQEHLQPHNTIATQNDNLRRNIYNPGKHQVKMTPALTAAIGDTNLFQNFAKRARILRAVYEYQFEDTTSEKHDLGYFEVGCIKCFFRIAAFNNDLNQKSPAPDREDVTTRILTIMLDHEY
jgi:Protein of unknown function (DUF3768)